MASSTKSTAMDTTSRTFHLLLSTNGIEPYHEDSVAEVLSTFNAAVLGQLLSVSDSYELQPSLIESWKWDFKTSSYELRLHAGLKFHNGREATAEDLEYSLLRGFFSKKSSFYRVYLSNVEGVDSIDPSKAKYKAGVASGIKIKDKYTLQIKLKNSNPAFLYALTNPYFSLVPREEINADFLTWKSVPSGAGPYKVIKPFSNGLLELERVNGISGGVNRVNLYTRDVKETYDLSLVSLHKNTEQYEATKSRLPISVWSVWFSNANQLGANPHFRKAISYLIDRKKIIGSMGPRKSRKSYELG